jgi:O-antigen ligase
MIQKIHRILFSLIVFLIPLNIGKHFINSASFVNSQYLDYLTPTLYGIDILIFLLIIFWFIDGGLNQLLTSKHLRLVFVFIVVLLPSMVIAPRASASVYFFSTLLLRLGLLFYASCLELNTKNFKKLGKLICFSIIFLSILAFGQWLQQGSVFDNYLVFGEQPYDATTFGVARASVFGRIRIPVYGTFRHPNVFAGYLSICLVWLWYLIAFEKKDLISIAAFLVGFCSLVLTFSQVALLTFILGVVFLWVLKRFGAEGLFFSVVIVGILFLSSLLLPYLSDSTSLGNSPSFYRRSNLLKSANMMLDESSLFGVGMNNFVVASPRFLPQSQILIFNQPVHNIFVLILAESGIFAFLTYFSLFIYAGFTALKREFGVSTLLFVSLLQFIILGCFDHYVYTIHQTQILFWLTIGLALSYTKVDAQL